MRPAIARMALVLTLAGCGPDGGTTASSETGEPTTDAPTTDAPTGGDTDAPSVCVPGGEPGGALKWSREAGDLPADVRAMATTPGSDVVVVGARAQPGEQKDAVVALFDAAGAPLWSDVYAGANGLEDVALDVAVDDAGFVHVLVKEMTLLVQQEGGGLADYRLVVLRYGPDGAHVWRWEWAREADPLAFYDPFGRLAIDGERILVLAEVYREPGVVTALDAAGNVLGETSLEEPLAVVDRRAFGPDGSIAIAGNDDDGNTNHPLWVGRFAGDGALLWGDSFGGQSDHAESLTVGPGGEVHLIHSNAGKDGFTYTLRRYAADGALAWTRPLPLTGIDGGGVASGRHCGGDLLLAGETMPGGGPALWAARYRVDGEAAWTASPGPSSARLIVGAPEGDVLVLASKVGADDALVPWLGRLTGG